MPRFVHIDGVLQEVPYDRDLPRPPSVFPAVQRDLPAYKSPVGTGWIDGRAARREDLARAGCRETDPSEFRPTAWDPANAAKYGLKHEPPPPTPEHVQRWQAGRLAQRQAVDAAAATPEMIREAAAQAIRTAEAKK